ncbi:MAG: IS200/IS605 family transposase [Kiritimatiellia bacterium]|jgi:REP element-mobilizing transposase RayT|nr:IS200/IS605 family transposase [Kiritimatiellia bacterium]
MFLPPVQSTTLRLASTNKVYLRWHTHRLRPLPALAGLTLEGVQELAASLGIRVVEFTADERNALALVMLLPTETVSACASKLKGRISKWLRGQAGLAQVDHVLGRGYFACTAGHTTREDVTGYLESQPGHHGYDQRILPPVFVKEWGLSPEDESRLNPTHAMALLHYHMVFAVANRHGVFGSESGPVIADDWRRHEKTGKFALLKAAFVPDHIHLAVRIHPSVAPAELAIQLMNIAQERLLRDFPEHLIEAGVGRLWPDSAYIGSYGDITAGTVQGYLRKWEAQAGRG